jgi:hypothetical protein
MLTLFGLGCHFCLSLGVHLHDKQDDGKSFRSHLGRIGIVESPVYVFLPDYEIIDHVLWGCERFDAERPQFWMDLRSTDTEWGTLIREILGERYWRVTTDTTWVDQSHNQTLNSFGRGPSLWSSLKKSNCSFETSLKLL